jgi:hypothetical protein
LRDLARPRSRGVQSVLQGQLRHLLQGRGGLRGVLRQEVIGSSARRSDAPRAFHHD